MQFVWGRVAGVMAAAMFGSAASAVGQAATPRVLYVTHSAGFVHESRIHAGDVIASLGQSSGAFTVTKMDDISQLTPAVLNTFDAVIFFTSSLPNGGLPVTQDFKTALLQFVSNGKGFVGLHGAADTFYDFPEYGQMLGGYFEDHPWVSGTVATITVEDQTHRSTKHLGASFQFTEEIYQFKNWSRSNVHVLLSLDTTSVPPLGGRADNDYALAWTKSFGSGRVFYTALGHEASSWDDPRLQTHVLQGIRYALGDADFDADDDGLLDAWETRFGLDRHSAVGASGPTGDPDADGATNAQELAANTHPNGTHQRYLAEGATGTFFETRIALVNPSASAVAHSQLRFMTEDGHVVTLEVTLPVRSRQTVFVDDVPGMASASFSTLVDSDQDVIVDRTMIWASGQAYGSHAETSVSGPSTQWFFAEGATHFRFDLFYLIQNPSPTQAALVTASYLPASGPPIQQEYAVPPNGRLTLQVDTIPGLDAADVAAAFTVTNAVPVIVERAMYLTRPGQIWAGGHASAGVTALAERWFLAEGASGSFFDTFVLIGNPNPTDAAVRISYLQESGGVVVRTHTVLARSRATFNFKAEAPELIETTASTIVESVNGVPVVVERAMWWPGPTPFDWYEGHSSLGTTETGTAWALADGEAAGPRNARTYVLVATADGPAVDSVKLTVFVEGGAAMERVYPNLLTPNRRFTLDMLGEFPELAGRRFGVLVEALGATFSGNVSTPVTRMPLVVERAMYHDVDGLLWAAGSNVVATRVQ